MCVALVILQWRSRVVVVTVRMKQMTTAKKHCHLIFNITNTSQQQNKHKNVLYFFVIANCKLHFFFFNYQKPGRALSQKLEKDLKNIKPKNQETKEQPTPPCLVSISFEPVSMFHIVTVFSTA